MNQSPTLAYGDTVRKTLRRRAEAVVSFCDELLERLHREDGYTASSTSQARLQRLVSFMVKYVRSQPLLASEFRRLVNLDTSGLSSPEGGKRCAVVEEALLAVVEYMDNYLRSRPDALPADIDRPRRWAGVQGDLPVSELLAATATEIRKGEFSSDPDLRIGEYGHIVARLAQPRVHLQLGESDDLDGLWQAYHEARSRLQHFLGYEVDYAGGMAAQMLAHLHFDLCPDEGAKLYDNQLKPIGYRMESMFEVAPPSIEDIRNATIEVHALLDAFMDGLAAKRYLVNRLAVWVQMYASAEVSVELETIATRKSSKVEERVFLPKVDEFLFNHGYYPLSEAQLGAGQLRLDVLAKAPEHDAWFLYELKQSGFGKARKSTQGDIERKLRVAVEKAALYHEWLEQLPMVQPDVYVVCFVKGNARFEGGNDPESGLWHHVARGRARFHLRLVNLRPSEHKGHELSVQASKIDPVGDTSPTSL